MSWELALVAAAYVLGSIPSALLVVWLMTGKDVRREGSGNVGATNAVRIGGIAAGILVTAMDVSKEALPVWAISVLNPASVWLASAMLAAVVGWAARSRTYWVVSTGLGMNMGVTVFLGILVGIVVVAQTLYTSAVEHVKEFGTVKAIGGPNWDIYRILAEQALIAAILGYAIGGVMSLAMRPAMAKLYLNVMISPEFAATVFLGTVVLALGVAQFAMINVALVLAWLVVSWADPTATDNRPVRWDLEALPNRGRPEIASDERMLVYRTKLSKTNEHPMAATVQAILGILGALGVLIVFLSSSLIANTLNALLNQHLHYIGVMKLIGARRARIFSMYIVLILSFGLIALVIAIPLGGQAAYALSNLIAEQMNFLLTGYRLVPLAIIVQGVIALVVPLAAGLIPVNNGSRIKVQSAISGVNPAQKISGGFLDRLGRHLHWLSRPMLLSLRNTFRRKGRLALTLLTLTMGGAIFIAVFNVQASLEQYIANIGNYFLADVSMSYERPYRINEVTWTALEVPGVDQVEGWAFVSAELLHSDGTIAENLQILAPRAESNLIDPMLVDGAALAVVARK